MDFVPAPSGGNPVKVPVVEVEAVDVAEPVSAESVAVEVVSSEYETDSDDSDGWDTLSHSEDTILMLRDEQLRDGLGTWASDILLSPLPRTPPLSESTLNLSLQCASFYSSWRLFSR